MLHAYNPSTGEGGMGACLSLPCLQTIHSYMLSCTYMLFWLLTCSLVFTCKSILHSWQEPQFPHWLSSLSVGYHIYFLLKTTEICFHSQLKSECLSCTLEKMKQPVDWGLGGRLPRAEGNVHLCNRDSGKAVSMSQHPLCLTLSKSVCGHPATPGTQSEAQLLPSQDVPMSEIPLQAAVPSGIHVSTKTYPDPIIQPSFQNTFELQVHRSALGSWGSSSDRTQETKPSYIINEIQSLRIYHHPE